MGTDPKAELARIAHHKELIEPATETIEHSTALVKQSRRLIRIARGHDVDGGNSHKTDGPILSEIRALTPSSTAQARETLRHCRLAK